MTAVRTPSSRAKPVRLMYEKTLLCAIVAYLPWCAMAQQSAAPAPATPSLEERMQRMETRQQELEEELKRKDAEIQQMKTSPTKPTGDGAAVPKPPPPGGAAAIPPDPLPAAAVAGEPDPEEGIPPLSAPDVIVTSGEAGAQAPTAKWGSYTPQFGFKVVDTDKGDMSIAASEPAQFRHLRKHADPPLGRDRSLHTEYLRSGYYRQPGSSLHRGRRLRA